MSRPVEDGSGWYIVLRSLETGEVVRARILDWSDLPIMSGRWGTLVGDSGREIDGREIIHRDDGPDLVVDETALPDDIFDDDPPRWRDVGAFRCPNGPNPRCDPD